LLHPSGLPVSCRPAVVVAVTRVDADEETGLFQVVAIQPGDITPGL
jgi:hypothetical protein